MAGACFGTPDLSALGAGKVHDYDNELMEAPEAEEAFDLMNDETFGDTTGDFDWEEQHERFAEELEGGNRTVDSGFDTLEKRYRTQEEYMEHSISQLVVDDDDVDDPAILNVSRHSRPIPRRRQDLDELFGPSSPPSFLDTEHLVSPSSKNIWSPPTAEASHSQEPVSNLQSLFEFAKSAAEDSPITHKHVTHHQAPVVLPKAQTLEEIEKRMMPKPQVVTAEQLERELRGEMGPRDVPQTPPVPVPSPDGRPGMRVPPYPVRYPQQGQSPHVNQQSPNIAPIHLQRFPPPGMSPAGVVMNGRVSPLIGMPAPLGTPPMPQHTGSPANPPMGRRSPLEGLIAGSPGGYMPGRSPTPPPLGSSPMGPRAVFPLQQARLMSPYARPALRAGGVGNNVGPGRNFSQPIGIPRSMGRMPVPPGSPFNSPLGTRNLPQGSPYNNFQGSRVPPPNHQAAFNDPGHIRNVEQHFHAHDRNYQPRGHINNRDRRGGYYYQQREPRHHQERGAGDRDEYAGIMTQKEKDWIIKIQLLQLQTDNPYLDDYYYTTYVLKQKAKEMQNEENGMKKEAKLVIPAMAKVESRSYKPAQFEGSLGRLTTSSVHNPRQIIDVMDKSVKSWPQEAKSKPVSRELRKSRQLLLEIEKGYTLLLDIDDIEKKILALPEKARVPLLEERQMKVNKLYRNVLCEESIDLFLQVNSIRKGRHLLSRALPVLHKVQSEDIMSFLMKNMQTVLKKDQKEQPQEGIVVLYPSLSSVIENSDLETLVRFAEDLLEESDITAVLKHQFGSSVVSCMLCQGEKLYKDTSPVDMDFNLQNTWSHFVHEFASALSDVPRKKVVPPLSCHEDIQAHMDRLLDMRTIANIEDKMSVFTEPHSGENKREKIKT